MVKAISLHSIEFRVIKEVLNVSTTGLRSIGEVRAETPSPWPGHHVTPTATNESGPAELSGDNGDGPPTIQLWLIFSVTLTGILANTLVNAPLPDILAEFDRPDSDAGLFVTAAALPGVFAALLIGLLADRYGRKSVLVPCLVVFGAAGLGGVIAPSYEALLVIRFVQGIGAAGLINMAVVLIGDNWSGSERARILGYNSAVLTSSLAVAPAVGGLLTEIGGWRASFFPYGLALVTALVVARTLPPGAPGTGGGLVAQLRGAGVILRTPVVLGAIAWGFVAFIMIFGLFLTVLPLHLEAEFGMGAGARGLVLAAPAIGSTTAAILLGRLRSRHGARRLVLVGAALFAIGFASIGAADSLVLLGIGALTYGVGEGMSIPTVQDVVTSSCPPESRGAVVAVFVSAVRAGQATGPLLAGLLLGSVTTNTVFLFGAMLAVALTAAIALLGGRVR